jgi:hypothetical protein
MEFNCYRTVIERSQMTVIEQTEEHYRGYAPVLLTDERLMRRIDAYAHQEYDTEHPLDACQDCGAIQPGYRYCRSCMKRIPRRRGVDDGFWIQEVVGEGHHQEAFQRIVGPALGAEDGGVHIWVTAALVPDLDDRRAVQVWVLSGGPAEHVGHIQESDATAVRRASDQVMRAYARTVACKGLINGGFMLDGGMTATYGISLLLPPVSRYLATAVSAIEHEAMGKE